MVDMGKDTDVAYVLRLGLESHEAGRGDYRHCAEMRDGKQAFASC